MNKTMPKSPIELTEAEMDGHSRPSGTTKPCDAPAIQQKLFKKTGWTYSTVRTLMDRMTAKKLLAAEKNPQPDALPLRRDAGAGAAQ